jgi:hypothetical protein
VKVTLASPLTVALRLYINSESSNAEDEECSNYEVELLHLSSSLKVQGTVFNENRGYPLILRISESV